MPLVARRHARYYLENAPSLLWLVVANVAGVLVGVDFYGGTMDHVWPFLWPLHMDSPTALGLMTLSLVTLVPNLGRTLDDNPRNLPLAYLHTFAFVWLLKYALWTAVALNVHPGAYFPELWAYWGILVTHLLFIPEAFLIRHYGATTRGALASALALLLVNDAVDYALGLHPPLRYEVGLVLPAITVALSVAVVALAARTLPRLDGEQSPARQSAEAAAD